MGKALSGHTSRGRCDKSWARVEDCFVTVKPRRGPAFHEARWRIERRGRPGLAATDGGLQPQSDLFGSYDTEIIGSLSWRAPFEVLAPLDLGCGLIVSDGTPVVVSFACAGPANSAVRVSLLPTN